MCIRLIEVTEKLIPVFIYHLVDRYNVYVRSLSLTTMIMISSCAWWEKIRGDWVMIGGGGRYYDGGSGGSNH